MGFVCTCKAELHAKIDSTLEIASGNAFCLHSIPNIGVLFSILEIQKATRNAIIFIIKLLICTNPYRKRKANAANAEIEVCEAKGGVRLVQDTIRAVKAAEDEAEEKIRIAKAACEKILAEAKADGEALIEKARQEAQADAESAMKDAKVKGEAVRAVEAAAADADIASMKAAAAEKQEQAIQAVIDALI